MTTYEDLTPYVYWSGETPSTVNVGWLGRESRFEVGEPEPGLAEALGVLVRYHRVHVTRGWHGCELCGPGAAYPVREPVEGTVQTLGSAEIRVPGPDGVVYAAPNLVHHYVVRHHYRPPAQFVPAVRAEAEARGRAWEEAKRSLPVGTPVRVEDDGYSVWGLSPDLDDFLRLVGPSHAELDAPDVDHVTVDTVVTEHVEDRREIVLRLPGTA